jgi:hypothetical protein
MLASIVGAGGYSSIGMTEEAISTIWSMAFYFVMFATLTHQEKHFVHVLGMLGFLSLTARVVTDCVVFDDARNLSDSPPYVEAVLIALGLFFSALMHRSLQRALGGGCRATARSMRRSGGRRQRIQARGRLSGLG